MIDHLGPNLLSFAVALVVAAVASPFIMRALVAAKSRQTVSQHLPEHAHKQGVPTMGGLIVLVGWVLGSLASPTPMLGPGVAVILLFAAIGFADDYLVPRLQPGKRGFGWITKLGLQVLAAIPAAFIPYETEIQPNMRIVAVVWVLFYANAFNFADGLDNLAGGIALWLVVGLQVILAQTTGLDPSLSALFAALLPFMVWNAAPAKVFMGDVASLPIGAYFGFATFRLVAQPASQSVWPVLVLSVVMFVMVVPVVLQIASVKVLKRRMFQFKTPVHHAFQEHGWDEPRIVSLFHAAQIVCSVGAVAAMWGLSNK